MASEWGQSAPTTLVVLPVLDAALTIPDRAFASTVAAPSSSDPCPAPLADPDFVQRYELGAPLGEGGMGVVRVAVDRRIGREIALKTLRAGSTTRDLVARFLREACVQGQLEHPAIVPVHDVGVDAEGALYFTMRRLRGVTLEQAVERLRAGDPDARYTRRRSLSAFASACHAVHFAHSRGVIHRDLKPANIMFGDFGQVYVLDWGVAKLRSVPEPSSAGERVSLTGAGATATQTLPGSTVGTPGYMAPEQARGQPDVDERVDVYSLGAVLFELLSLQPLHPATSLEATIGSTLRGADARPSVRAPHVEVPPELEAICVKATALRPEHRFQSVGELVEALERFLDGDRDLELRRAGSRTHTASAEEATEQALGPGSDATEARRRALREVGRALALDPTNTEATGLLVRLLTEPPSQMPAEALAAVHAARDETRRTAARGALFGYLAWFAFLPFRYWMGVRDPRLATLASLLWAAAAAAAYVTLRRPRSRGGLSPLGIVMTAAAACVTSAVCGPYVLVPTLAVINVTLWLLLCDRAQRLAVIGLGCLTVLLPAALEWAHVVHFYNFREGRVTILQGMLDFPPAPTHGFFLATSLGLVGVAAALVIRFRDHLTDAERRLHLHAWQLRHLVPRGEPETASSHPRT